MNEVTPSPGLLCANCTVPLQGEFCHGCGQSIHSVLRPMSHMLEDAGDIFFHMDERIVHTVPPLYTRPGFLTLEYFSGRRVRYIAPFRLMFVFCLLCFFFMHLALSGLKLGKHAGEGDSISAFAEAKTADDVHELYDDQTRELVALEKDPKLNSVARTGLQATRTLVRESANRRLAELQSAPIPAVTTDPDKDDDGYGHTSVLSGFDKIDIRWLPDAVNARLTAGLQRLKLNVMQSLNGGPQQEEATHRIIEGVFGVLPQTMFIMIPVFALVLKVFYLFRRRLYMEHLIVALQSHAFLFLSLMLLTLLGFAKGFVTPYLGFAGGLIGLVSFAMWIWIPVYLLLMQKRVYAQGWGMTILKYWLIGSIYFWLLMAALFIAVVIGSSH
ncbi:DUF3667 domain-containing protein [Bacillus sp. NP157]|nr:DUF3667 domain-containing protein [Bacillus sp. NP157]